MQSNHPNSLWFLMLSAQRRSELTIWRPDDCHIERSCFSTIRTDRYPQKNEAEWFSVHCVKLL
jgi:hypothetical protein